MSVIDFTPIYRAIYEGDISELSGLLSTLNPSNLSYLITQLSDDHQMTVFLSIDMEKRVELMAFLDPNLQLSILQGLSKDMSKALIEKMPHDSRVDLLNRLPSTKRNDILHHLAKVDREDILKLSEFEEGTAGSIMTSDYAILHPNQTTQEAIEKLRVEAYDHELIYYAYVVNEERQLIGTVTLRSLIVSNPKTKISEILTSDLEKVDVNEPAEKASQKLKQLDLLAIPVVDSSNKLVGIITFDDAMQALEDDVSDTMYQKAGVMTGASSRDRARDILYSKKLTKGNIFYPIRLRILFLFVTLAGGFLVGSVIDNFENLLSAILVAAVFIPVIMDMGGNVGTQSTTIFARGLALGHINVSKIWSHIGREVSIGVFMGLILGLIGGTVAYFWQGLPNGIPEIGIAVGISLAVVVPLATFLGFFLPFVLLKLGLDHAPGADPFITTIKDFVGLALYFSLVSVLIGV